VFVGTALNIGLSVLTQLMREKNRRDRLIQTVANHPDVVVGFEDDVWWRRAAQPQRHTWRAAQPVRLVDKSVPATDPEGTAVACDGL
jgi:hypothetical protein